MFRKSTRLAALGFLLLPAVAVADHRFDTRDRDRGDRYENRGHVNIEVRGGGYEYRPVVREERVWVEPVYRTVCDRVWVEPVTQREIYDRVWVPDRYEWRETVCWEYGRRVVRGQSVLVEPGHFEDRCREVVIVPGHYEVVNRIAAAPVARERFSVGLRIPIGH